MASLARCSSCQGFLPASVGACPNCGTPAPTSLADRVGFWLKAAGGASVAMTLMACYGLPVDPYDPTDTDPSEGTGGASGDTAMSSSSSGGTAASTGAESTGAESTGAESTGAESTGGGTDSTGAGAGAEPPPSR
jgi:hypothetical protein